MFNRDAYRSHLDADFYLSSMSGSVGRRFYRLEAIWNRLNPEDSEAE
ncbi:MAG: hypothetical protein H6557_25240 [Lewinellaceae bacterium]|nr:hypothetical protein [Phaeodactylibacter sp.]MCB9039939.1 hypothetical protein [Lewinellaceae bacterium]